jgi:hypothetical protein
MATLKLDRKGLAILIKRGYNHSELAEHFALSRNWTIQVIRRGREPQHPGIIQYINAKIKALLAVSA